MQSGSCVGWRTKVSVDLVKGFSRGPPGFLHCSLRPSDVFSLHYCSVLCIQSSTRNQQGHEDETFFSSRGGEVRWTRRLWLRRHHYIALCTLSTVFDMIAVHLSLLMKCWKRSSSRIRLLEEQGPSNGVASLRGPKDPRSSSPSIELVIRIILRVPRTSELH